MPALVDRRTALGILGVKPQTLYAYVSRGLIRRAPGRDGRTRLYYREDVEAIGLRGRVGAGERTAGESVLRWGGAAVLPTAITALGERGPIYRGWLALDLVDRGVSFEQCAELLWSGTLPPGPLTWDPLPLPDSFLALTGAVTAMAGRSPARRILALLVDAFAAAVGEDPERAFGEPLTAARQLIRALAPAFGLLRSSPRYVPRRTDASIASLIARSAGIRADEDSIRLLNACLVLVADHELAPASFVARIAASAGADLYASVASALAAFEALLTSAGCDACEAVLRSARNPGDYVDMLKRRSAMLDGVPGYNHAVYLQGDPRAELLLELVRRLGRGDGVRHVLSCIDAARRELGVKPSVVVGIVAACAALRMPPESAGALMAIGRTAGWVAHALEHRLTGFMVCPRARYVGPTHQPAAGI